MAFSDEDRELLLKVKGVGPKVVERLEQMGFSSLGELAEANASEITQWIAGELGTTCWRNSPQARSAVESAISVAKQGLERRN